MITNTRLMVRSLLLLLIFVTVSSGLTAQDLAVTGTVTEKGTGQTLVGATILQKGTTHGTVCDIDGKYSITVPPGATLVFSLVGYVTKEITVEHAGTLDVEMEVEITNLGEVIVIGYGTQKKSDKTGAVALVKSEELNGGVITSPIQALQGKAAGVLISKKGGDPSESFSVKIRGASGFQSSTQPLYVIDGVPGADPAILTPNEIESYNILKDAASAAIYGSRGSNGVVIITTKSGKSAARIKEGKGSEGSFSTIEFTSQVSIEWVAKKLPLLTGSQVRDYANLLLAEKRQANPDSTYTIEDVFHDGGANTDWQDVIFRTGVSTTNSLNVAGGNKSSSYLGSISHSDWSGIMRGTSKELTTAKINLNHKAFNDRLTLTGNILASFENNDYENYDGWDKDDIIYQAISRNPTDPVYTSTGGYYKSQRVFNYENPLTPIDQVTNNRKDQKFLGNLRGDFEFLKGLIGSVNIGYIRDDNTTNYFSPAGIYSAPDLGNSKKQSNNNTQKLIELTGTYTKSFHDLHNINFLLGYSWQETVESGFYAQARNSQSPYAGPDNIETLNDVSWGDVNSWRGASTLVGFFGRGQYNYKNKYYISASLRRDGSSRFGENHKWGWFPTAAIGWSIEKEKFMRSVKWLDQLKIRASYGVSGNQEIGNYHSLILYEPYGQSINPETGQTVVSFRPAWNSNPDLKWEETAEVNLGLDFALIKERISGSLEVYHKTTKDLLGEYAVPTPPNRADRTWANSGSLQNEGIELFLQFYVLSRKNLSWKTSLTGSHNKTKFLDLGTYTNPVDGVRKEGYISGRGMVSGDQYYLTGVMEGQELGAFYLPTYVGLKDGLFVYISKSGGFTDSLSNAKRTFMGTAAPKFELGWSNYFTLFHHLNIEFSFRAWIGNKVYNATKMLLDFNGNLPDLNALPDALDWHDQGRVSGPSIADIYLEDASFVKMDYLNISYDFNVSKIKWISKFSLYASTNNLFTITGYSGVDPETKVDGLAFGIDQYNVYPKTRSITIGLKATF
jgi:TonB-dependent starch-binding outer membrane protein SusC